MRVTGLWAGQGASSSCLKSGRKSQQISYRDDCWSGSFHPAPQGSRHGGFGKKRSHSPITISYLTLLQRCCSAASPPSPRDTVQPSVTDAWWRKRSTARLAAWRPCSISTPEKVSHKHELPLRTAVSRDPTGSAHLYTEVLKETSPEATGSGQRDGLLLGSVEY